MERIEELESLDEDEDDFDVDVSGDADMLLLDLSELEGLQCQEDGTNLAFLDGIFHSLQLRFHYCFKNTTHSNDTERNKGIILSFSQNPLDALLFQGSV